MFFLSPGVGEDQDEISGSRKKHQNWPADDESIIEIVWGWELNWFLNGQSKRTLL
jgi:hypothetical protein